MARIGNWKGLVRYYHVLLSRLGMSHDDGGAMIAEMYKAEHLSDLTYEQLSKVCDLLDEQIRKAGGMMASGTAHRPYPTAPGTRDARAMARDKLRRQAKASCGGLLATQGKIQEKNWGPKDWQVIMGTIYNASGKKEFDSLSNQELRALSFEFNKQRKALEAILAEEEALTEAEMKGGADGQGAKCGACKDKAIYNNQDAQLGAHNTNTI